MSKRKKYISFFFSELSRTGCGSVETDQSTTVIFTTNDGMSTTTTTEPQTVHISSNTDGDNTTNIVPDILSSTTVPVHSSASKVTNDVTTPAASLQPENCKDKTPMTPYQTPNGGDVDKLETYKLWLEINKLKLETKYYNSSLRENEERHKLEIETLKNENEYYKTKMSQDASLFGMQKTFLEYLLAKREDDRPFSTGSVGTEAEVSTTKSNEEY